MIIYKYIIKINIIIEMLIYLNYYYKPYTLIEMLFSPVGP